MKGLLFVAAIAVLFGVISAYNKCCPQPESEGMCDCCPDACCCICENTTVTSAPVPGTSAPPLTATTTIECEVPGLDVIIIADSSNSVGTKNWALTMDFLAFLVATDVFPKVGTKSRFGMIEFDSFAVKHWGVNDAQSDSSATLWDAFRAIPYFRGFTNISDGYFLAIDEFENNDRDDMDYKDLAIVLSDGRPNRGNSTLDEAVAGLQAATDLVFGIGITDAVDMTIMNRIVDGDNGENVVLVDDFGDLITRLNEILAQLLERICETIVDPPPPPNTPAPPVPGTSVIAPNCKCCCPPLPDPCGYYPYEDDPCCCRFDY